MTTTAAISIEQSNSLADLAARIRAEHEASTLAIKRGLQHAITCGRLLIEAKAQLRHGQWLPWLREHCQVPERSAQRYMQLAIYAADAKSDNLADLALDGVATASVSLEKAIEAGDWGLVATLTFDAPFTAEDMVAPDRDFYLTKLLHQLRIPAIASWCAELDCTTDSRPAWRLCPWDQLIETLTLLVPLAHSSRRRKDNRDDNQGKLPTIKLDFASFDSMQAMEGAIWELRMHALRLLGGILVEIEHRDGISDAQYQKEWDETHKQVMARLDEQLAVAAAARKAAVS
jgi:hypothetical protein